MKHAWLPYLATGAVSVVTSARKNGARYGAPSSNVILATTVLILIAAASDGTKLEPVVSAFGILIFIVTLMRAVPAFTGKTTKKGSTNV